MRTMMCVMLVVSASAGSAMAQTTAANTDGTAPAPPPSRAVIQPDASGKTVVGAALVFGTEPSTLGLQLDGYVPVSVLRGLRVGGDLTMYLPFSEGSFNLFWFSLNPGAQFVFDVGVPIHPYIEAGLAIVIVHESAKGGAGTNTDTELGLNLGGGAEYDLGFGRAFGALRFQFLGNSRDQAEFMGGMRWAF